MKRVTPLLSAVLVLMVSLPGLSEDSVSETLQPTPAPKPTQMVSIESADQWPLLLYESFDDNRNDWPVGDFDDRYATGSWEIAEGEYRWDVTARRDVAKRVTPNVGAVSDFFLTVEARRNWGPENASYDVIFQDENGEDLYAFGISDIGVFSFFLLYKNQWQPLIDWTSTDAIRPGATNQITIIALGSHFTLMINGELVGEVEDDHLERGHVGLAIELYDQSDHAGFTFDNFELRAPSSEASQHVEVFEDDFSDTDSGWEWGEMEGGSWGYSQGSYSITAEGENDFTWSYLKTLAFSDAMIDVDMTQIAGPSNDHHLFGVFCRYQPLGEDSFEGYLMAITGYGYYAILRFWDGEWYTVVDGNSTEVIRTGNATNHIQASCEGPRLGLSVNGVLLVQGEDRAISRGHVAFLVSNFADERTEIHFDNLVVQILSAQDSANALITEASRMKERGELEAALEKYHEALDIFQQEKDPEMEGEIWKSIGDIHRELGQHQLALESYLETLEIWRTSGDPYTVIWLLLNEVGDAAEAVNGFEAIVPHYQEALLISQTHQYWEGEAEALNRLGILHLDLSDYEQAILYFQEALRIWKAHGDRLNESRATNNIGVVYGWMGDDENALPYFQQALNIAMEIDDPWREAIWRANIGDTYYSLGDMEMALEYYLEAQTLFEQEDDPRKYYMASNLMNIGLAHQELGYIDQALSYLQEALRIMDEETDSRSGVASALNSLGYLYKETSENQKALDYLTEALAISRTIGAKEGEVDALVVMGEVYEALGEEGDALEQYLDAIEVVEGIFGEVRSGALQLAYAGQSAEIYQKAVRLLVVEGRLEEAFNLSEQGKARAFLDGMGNKRPDLRSEADTVLLREEELLRNELAALEEALLQEKSKPTGSQDQAWITTVEEELYQKQQAYQELLTRIELTSPALASLVSIPTVTSSQIQDLLDENTTLLSYYFSDEDVLAFIVTSETLDVVRLQVEPETITDTVESFRTLGLANLENPLPRSLKDLYGWLVEPVKSFLNTPLVGVVPHQALHYLPFAALGDGEKIFGEDHVLFQLPSMSTLPYLETKTTREIAKILVLGDPLSGNPDLPPLHYADQEARSVAELFSDEPYIGKDASEDLLINTIGEASIVHLAAHGGFNPVAPLFSRLWLTPGDNEDGQLNVYEVYGLDLENADLVVLSACDTQMGELSAGDEVVGLNRAFLYGSPTVVASLWSVDDEATGSLMEKFYRHLLEGVGKAQALQAAQDEIRNDPDHPEWAHPYYWAAFVLNGDPGEVVLVTEAETISEPEVDETKNLGLYILLGALCGLGGIIGVTYYIKRKRRKSPQEHENHVQSNEKVT
jgi:CHAT domain-containing protein/Tfp pilus assembly protein PilF